MSSNCVFTPKWNHHSPGVGGLMGLTEPKLVWVQILNVLMLVLHKGPKILIGSRTFHVLLVCSGSNGGTWHSYISCSVWSVVTWHNCNVPTAGHVTCQLIWSCKNVVDVFGCCGRRHEATVYLVKQEVPRQRNESEGNVFDDMMSWGNGSITLLLSPDWSTYPDKEFN